MVNSAVATQHSLVPGVSSGVPADQNQKLQRIVYVVTELESGNNPPQFFLQIHKDTGGIRTWQLPGGKIDASIHHLEKAKTICREKLGITVSDSDLQPVTLRNITDPASNCIQKVFVYHLKICSQSIINNALLAAPVFPFVKEKILNMPGRLPVARISEQILRQSFL